MRKLKQSEIKEYRTQMLSLQYGKCKLCDRECVKPVLDHAHNGQYKDKIRGVICNSCNIYLGKIENARVRMGVPIETIRHISGKMWKYIHGHARADWHPSKRKSEVIAFKKLKAAEQVGVLMVVGETPPKTAKLRVALFKKLNAKT